MDFTTIIAAFAEGVCLFLLLLALAWLIERTSSAEGSGRSSL